MTWFAVDDRFPTHAKVYELQGYVCHDSALALWVKAGSWASGQQGHNYTGFIPSHMIHAFGVNNPTEAAQALCDVLLWEQREGGYWFHDWADWNGPGAQQNRSKEQTRQRVQLFRLRQCEDAGDDLLLHDSHCPTTDMDGNPRTCPLRESKRDRGGEPSSQPDPSRPGVTLPSVSLVKGVSEGVGNVTHGTQSVTESVTQSVTEPTTCTACGKFPGSLPWSCRCEAVAS